MPPAKHGAILISINSGDAKTLAQSHPTTEYFVSVLIPPKLCRSPPTIESTRVTPSAFNRLSATASVTLDNPAERSDTLTVRIVEYGILFTNNKVGEGTLALSSLFASSQEASTSKDQQIVLLKDKSGGVLAEVNVSISWANGVPRYVSGTDTNEPENEGGDVDDVLDSKKPTQALDPLPAPEGRDYTVRVIVHKARNLQGVDRVEYNPVVVVTVANESRSTDHEDTGNNPHFDEELMMEMKNVNAHFFSTPIVFSVADHRMLGRNTIIGMTTVDAAVVYRSPDHCFLKKWLVLRKGGLSSQVMGFLRVTIMVLDALTDRIPDINDDDDGEEDEEEEATVMSFVSAPGAQFEETFLKWEIFQGEGIPVMDQLSGGKASPYLKCVYGVKKGQCPPKPNTLDPTWDCVIPLTAQLPALVDTLFITLRNHNSLLRDEVIATTKLSFNALQDPATALPRLHAQFLNFYGSPRALGGVLSRRPEFFNAMDKGLVEGVDFRGRVLLRAVGSRDRSILNQAIGTPPPLVKLTVNVRLQPMHFSMLQLKKGSYSLRLSVGIESKETKARAANPMSGKSDHLGWIFFGDEELNLMTTVVVALPSTAEVTVQQKFLEKQLPDVIVHLCLGGVSYAAHRLPMERICGTPEAKHYCQCLRLLIDPEKRDDGEQPSEPLGQYYCGAFVSKMELLPQQDKKVLNEQDLSLIKVLQAVSIKVPSPASVKWFLEVCVFQCQQLPPADPNGLADPFIRVSWGNGSAQTGHHLETLSPMHNEMIVVEAEVHTKFPDIVVEIWDWDFIGSNDFMCRAVVPEEWAREPPQVASPIWIENFYDSRGKKVPGARALLSFEFYTKFKPPAPATLFRKADQSESYRGFALPPEKALKTALHRISVGLQSLRKMRKYRLLEVKAATVKMLVAGHQITVDRTKEDLSIFKQFAIRTYMPIDPNFRPQIEFKVFDQRIMKVLVGAASVSLDDAVCNPIEKEKARKDADERVRVTLLTIEEKKKMLLLKENEGQRTTTGSGAAAPTAGGALRERSGTTRNNPNRESLSENFRAASNTAEMDPKGTDPIGPNTAEDLYDQLQDANNEKFSAVEAAGMQDVVEATVPEAETEYDIPWFDRLDPPSDLNPSLMVARLGRLYLAGKDRKTEMRTAEECFGPFIDEQSRAITLHRGRGKTRAGELLADIAITSGIQGSTPYLVEPIQPLPGKATVNFVVRAYVIQCRNLTAKDRGFMGNSSDPYLVFSLIGNTGKVDKQTVVSQRDSHKNRTLNPEFFVLQELEGDLVNHSVLRIAVFDYNTVASDELVGYTDVNLEDRWNSHRGYPKATINPTTKALIPNPQWATHPMRPGSYTETRSLRCDKGIIHGNIELWVDMFEKDLTPEQRPPSICITPPPPIELELRAIIWNTRDILLVDKNIAGEIMTDIYVRGWLNGIRHDMQSTDVHYRSLDGSGNFNWRLIFPFVFEPRTKRIMPLHGSAKSTILSFFAKREQKKYDPVLKLQIFDNEMFPGTDDFIGEVSLNLLRLRPTTNTRKKERLLNLFFDDVTTCCGCCTTQTKKSDREILLDAQQIAEHEFKEDLEKQREEWKKEAVGRRLVLELTKAYSPEELQRFEKQFEEEAKRRSVINILEKFLPKRKKIGGHGSTAGTGGPPAADNTPAGRLSMDELPDISETPKYWFACRGPQGAARVGDIQVSFQLVRVDALKNNEKLSAGKGRSEPQALPEPDRPASSFFWLTSPWKVAVHILWKNYKWYLLTILCLVLAGVFAYVFLSEAIREKARETF